MIAVYGDNCLDIYEHPAARFVGGNAVNTAVHLAHLGIQAAYFGIVGDDDAGAQIRVALESRGVDCSHVAVRKGASGVTWIDVREGERVILGDRVGVQCPQTLSAPELDALAEHPFVHASGYTAWNIAWRDACPNLVEELQFVAARGTHTSLDFSELDEPELAARAGTYVRVAFVSRGPGRRDADLDRTAAFFHSCGVPEVVVTLGADGALYSGPDECFRLAAEASTPVDTLGAGDAFIAGWLFERSRGASPRRSMETAGKVAADVCRHFGAWPQAHTAV